MNYKLIKFFLVAVIVLNFFGLNSFGQKTSRNAVLKTANAKKASAITLKHKSVKLNREMSFRVIFPKKYKSNKEDRFPVLYLLHGLTGNFKNWSDKTKLDKYLSERDLIVVMPDGHNSWYTNNTAVKNHQYESYLIDELIPKIDKDFRTKKNRDSRIIAGLSMGGYGALKFGIKHPDKFILAGSFSGALRAAEWNGKDFAGWKTLADSLDSAFGVANSKARLENNLFKIIESKPLAELDKLPFFYVDCGTEDRLLKQNQEFAKLLLEQKVPHEFRQLPGKHDWKYWDSQIQEFLQLSDKFIK